MPIENEPVAAEKIRKKKFIAWLGQCLDCGQPIKEGQEYFRSEDGIRHALCVFDPAFAKHVRELELKTGQ
jgi:hypothetical protein